MIAIKKAARTVPRSETDPPASATPPMIGMAKEVSNQVWPIIGCAEPS